MVDSRFYPFSGDCTLHKLLSDAGYKDIAENLPASDFVVTGAGELETAGVQEIAVAASRQYAEALSATNAGVVLVSSDVLENVPSGCVTVVAEDARSVFTDLLEQLYPDVSKYLVQRAGLGADGLTAFEGDVTIGQGTLIGPDVEIGAGTVVGPNCVIGGGVVIGRNCVIGAGVSIECALIGNDVFIQPGARIGVEGFGWLDHGRSNRKVPQLGRVIIQDNVQIGTNTVVDRGALGDTSIGEGTKIDNLVQIGHNCQIGRNCLIAATSGLSGSTIFGDSVLVGGGVGTAGHLSVGSGSLINGRAAVTKDWPAGSKLAGAPAQDAKDFWRELAALRRLTKGDKK